MKAILVTLISLFILCSLVSRAQQATQTVKGTVLDAQSEVPLIGVSVEVLDLAEAKGTVTDVDGRFILEEVPVGRQAIRFSYLGYKSITLPNVWITAGKEVALTVSLEETAFEMDEVVVTAETEKDRTVNDMAAISARTFDLEEVTRFSGGRNDVARLVGNFAGVAVADDSRNDIVIRGNSPTGVLWRLEGVPIPNPNHFSTLGTTGGPVSAINPNLLRTSDFLTSAFPAEYGNALAGVFDIGFRSGNKDRYEFTAQLAAFSGLEAMAEGPISKKNRSSFLVSYRHSFVELAEAAGIPVGTNATPNYKDLSFKLDLGQSKAGQFSIFGIGALSDIDFLGEETDETDLFADPNSDSFTGSKLGIIGLRHNIIVGDDAYIRTVISYSAAETTFDQDKLLDTLTGRKLRVTESNDLTQTYAVSSYFNKKFSPRFTLRTGVVGQYMQLDTRVRDRNNRPDLDDDGLPDWVTVRDFDGGLGLYQVFAQGQYKLSENWTVNGGLHAQYLDLNNSTALEPRLTVNWEFRKGQTLSLGYGLHQQMQPLPVYFFEEQVGENEFRRTNEDLDFTSSNHFVLGYDARIGVDWRVKVETYYQAINNVPVEMFPSSFSMLNAGADFVFPEVGSLVNEGTGRNLGLELTLEKFFNRGYYGLLTVSLFDSKYEGSDGIERNTAFNNGYVLNFLAGKEFRIGKSKRNAFTIDTKVTWAGGRYYTPIDLEASQRAGEQVLIEEEAFSLRQDPYFRWDLKFGFQLNSKKKRLSQQFFIDLQNLTNRNNIFVQRFNETTGEINNVYQNGFFPDLLYRIQF